MEVEGGFEDRRGNWSCLSRPWPIRVGRSCLLHGIFRCFRLSLNRFSAALESASGDQPFPTINERAGWYRYTTNSAETLNIARK